MATTFKARLQDIPFPIWPRQHVAYWLMGIEVRTALPGLGGRRRRDSIYLAPNSYHLRESPRRTTPQIVCALIVLGTSAAVISDFTTWSSCTTSATSKAQYCTIATTSPQGYINIALFTSIIGFLFIGTLSIGEYIVMGQYPEVQTVSVRSPASRQGRSPSMTTNRSMGTTKHMDRKVLFGASLVFFPLLWIFWFTSVITTTILCDRTSSKWHTLNASCAFTWFSWFATSGSCYIVGKEVWERRTARDGSAKDAGGSGRVQVEATTVATNGGNSMNDGSGRLSKMDSMNGSGAISKSASVGSGVSQGGSAARREKGSKSGSMREPEGGGGEREVSSRRRRDRRERRERRDREDEDVEEVLGVEAV